MKNRSNFAKTMLTKSEMNEVKGGWRCFVVTKYQDGGNEGYWIEVPNASNAHEAVSLIGRPEGAVGVTC